MKKIQQAPQTTPIADILPNEPLLLMGAGPVPIPYAVARANSVVINHLGEAMDNVIRSLKDMSQYVFQTKSKKILGVGGSASAAMEMAITNLLWPGRKVLILKMGTFSGRFGEMAKGVGADVTFIESEPGTPVMASRVKEIMEREEFDVVTMAQGETSCCVQNTELEEISSIAKEHGALVIVDAVCTLSTMPFFMDRWKVDVAITGGQKGLSSIPGVSLIAFSDDAWDLVEKRPNPAPHWYLDAIRAQKFWGGQQYHYTAPVPGILAIHEALRLICEETLEVRHQRHKLCSSALQAGLENMGLELFVEPKYRLNSVVGVKLPDGVDSYRLRRYMAKQFSVEIAGAFGLNIVRIGQMGEQCRSHNLFQTLYALGMSFKREGVKVNISEGMAAMEKILEIEGGAEPFSG